jgi:hypothetical protein
MEVADCDLLVRFYAKPEWAALVTGLTQAQINAKKAAINGHLDQLGCHAWFNSFAANGRPGNFLPEAVTATGTIVVTSTTPRNNCLLPASFAYDPVTNPNGLRCSGWDHAVSLWGSVPGFVPGTTRARITRDNVGVQYGLGALRAGAITAEEFVVLNEKIGGSNADTVATAARSPADLDALPIAYRAGIVSDGAHLRKTPIIDLRGWDDSGIHHIWRSFALRARLDAAGGHGNHAMWRFGTGLLPPASSGLLLASFLTMDRWVAAINADTSGASIEDKIVANRPADSFDFCYLTSDTTFSTKVTDFAACDQDPRLVRHSSPRQVAGGPLAENVLKCQLRPLDAGDYAPATLSDAQMARLAAVFPDGVCDWSKPGVGQQEAISPLEFSGGPGGTPLPAAPQSTPL